jgi:NAD(P)-dependent dehydrogenase (short-subunit alcohol dehydrogenase family)
MILNERTLVVSGVGVGLGREVARVALRDGANVVLAARTASVLEEAAAELDPTGARVLGVPADITSPDDCARLVEAATGRFGAVHALAQVAAYEAVMGPILDQDLERWRRAWETNVIGALTLIRAVVPAMREQGGGAIVLVGSQSMYKPLMPQAGYAASKGGLLSTMYYLADELGPDHIRVNMVVPSWMWGPPVEGLVRFRAKSEGRSEADVKAEIAAGIPLGEIVPDEDVAEVIVLMASDRMRGVTGQSLMVNGGELMR